MILTFVNFFIMDSERCFSLKAKDVFSWNAKDAEVKIGKKGEVPFYF